MNHKREMVYHWLNTNYETCCSKARHGVLTIVPVTNSIFEVNCPECKASKKFILDKKEIECELSIIENAIKENGN